MMKKEIARFVLLAALAGALTGILLEATKSRKAIIKFAKVPPETKALLENRQPVFSGKSEAAILDTKNYPLSYCSTFTMPNKQANTTTRCRKNISAPSVGMLGEWYGRLGNRLRTSAKMIAHAEAMNCSVEIPSNMLEDWTPRATAACFLPADNSTTTFKASRDICGPKDAKTWYRQNNSFSACATHLMSSYFGINQTHALGRACPAEPYSVLHVRSGDVVKGQYDSKSGVYRPSERVHKSYWAYPTAYYLAAVKGILARENQIGGPPPKIYILCEDLGNPTCEFFQKTAALIHQEANFTLRVHQPLIDDLHILLCAREVAVSNGSFKEVLRLSQKLQVTHTFSLEATNCSSFPQNTIPYWIANAKERDLFNFTNAIFWANTGYQRHQMNAHYEMASCAQH